MDIIRRISELTNNGFTAATAAKQVEEEYKHALKLNQRVANLKYLDELKNTEDADLNNLILWLEILLPTGASVDTVLGTFKALKGNPRDEIEQEEFIL